MAYNSYCQNAKNDYSFQTVYGHRMFWALNIIETLTFQYFSSFYTQTAHVLKYLRFANKCYHELLLLHHSQHHSLKNCLKD